MKPGSDSKSQRSSKKQDAPTSFAVLKKKTPYLKQKAEEEAKKKRDQEETAKLFEEFSESFRVDDSGRKSFVRGGTINPNKVGGDDAATAPKKPQRYVPSFLPPSMAATPSSRDKPADKKEEPSEQLPVTVSNKTGEKKARNIDFFLEELKREQEARERRESRKETKSGFDEIPDDPMFGNSRDMSEDGDPLTTNLYVGNLAPQVDENFLLRTFGRFGPIASVKIMWPRTEEEKRRNRNCGFVAFMRRGDAAKAKDEMQNIIIYEYELRIGWGKAVNLPSSALPAPPPGQMAVRPKGFDIHGKSSSSIAWSEPDGGAQNSNIVGGKSEVVVTPNVADIVVTPPENSHLRHVIDTMAQYVLDDGCPFEQAVMERGKGNALFSFLFDLGTPEHTYYVWRLYSFAQGDTLQRWRTEPYIMITGSGRWIPPPIPEDSEFLHAPQEKELPSGRTFAAGRAKKGDLERALTDPQRDEFEDMLRALTFERAAIKAAMVFCLDNADAAGEIVEVVTDSLTLQETLIPTKVARLMLLSDVLHNSSAAVKNASAYRTGFQLKLPDILESFNSLYCSITGRMTAEALKERVLKVLQVWSDWFIFSEAYIAGLRSTFLRPTTAAVPDFHLLPLDGGDYLPLDPTLGLPEEGAEEELLAKEELSGLPVIELERRCRFNGLSTRGGVQVMIARLLSLEAMERARNEVPAVEVLAAKLESAKARLGAVKKDRLAGESGSRWMEVNRGAEGQQVPGADVAEVKEKVGIPTSKWAVDDVDEAGADVAEGGGEKVADVADSPDGNVVAMEGDGISSGVEVLSEEKRIVLRKLELATMEYREAMEASGLKSFELDVKVAAYRKKLESQIEEGTWPPKPGSEPTGSSAPRAQEKGSSDRRKTDDEKRKRRSDNSPTKWKRDPDWDADRPRDGEREHGRRGRDHGSNREKGRDSGWDRDSRSRDHNRESDRYRDSRSNDREYDRDKRSRRTH